MADFDQGKRDWYCGAGYAPFRHKTRQGSHGDVSKRYRTPSAVLCRWKWTHQHPSAPGGRNRRGKGAGNPVRKAAAAASKQFYGHVSAMEMRENYRDESRRRMWDAVVNLPVQSENLWEKPLAMKQFCKKVYFFAKVFIGRRNILMALGVSIGQ